MGKDENLFNKKDFDIVMEINCWENKKKFNLFYLINIMKIFKDIFILINSMGILPSWSSAIAIFKRACVDSSVV